MKQILNGYVLVKKVQETNTDGLQFAQALESFIYIGEVVQSSVEIVDEGDIVYFLKHSGEEIPVYGENMKFVHYKDLIAIK